MSEHYTFYAFNVNGYTAAVFKTSDEALAELSIRLREDDSDSYAIEPIDGIWRMLERIADFDGRDDDRWMEEVLRQASEMVFDKKAQANSKDTPPKNKNSK